MILLSLPTSYVYANEGETNDQMLSEKAQSESGDLSSTTSPDDLLPDGNDEKENEDEAKGVVPPPDVPQPTYDFIIIFASYSIYHASRSGIGIFMGLYIT